MGTIPDMPNTASYETFLKEENTFEIVLLQTAFSLRPLDDIWSACTQTGAA